MLPGSRKPRRGKFRRKTAQIGKAGGEADEENPVFGGAIEVDHALRSEAGVAGHVFDIRAACAAERRRNFDGSGFGLRFFRRGSEALANDGFHLGMQVKARVEIHQHGGKCRMQIQNASNALQATRKAINLVMRLKRDLLAERHKKGAVAGRTDSHFQVMLPLVANRRRVRKRSRYFG